MGDNLNERLAEAREEGRQEGRYVGRQEGFDDRVSYINCIEKVEDGLRLIREGRIPKNVTDTSVDFFELSVKKLYQKARIISSKYSDPDGERAKELNKLDALVREACNGVKRWEIKFCMG